MSGLAEQEDFQDLAVEDLPEADEDIGEFEDLEEVVDLEEVENLDEDGAEYGEAEDLTDAVSPAPEDPPEILSLEYLQTPAEAEAYEAEAAQGLVSPQVAAAGLSSSRRQRKKPDAPLSARQIKMQRRAKMIIHLGLILLVIAVLVLASWRVPMYLYPKHLDSPRIWPWTKILGPWQKKKKAEEVHVYNLADGRTIEESEFNEIYGPADRDITQADGLYFKAETLHKDATAEGVSDEDKLSKLREAVGMLDKAISLVEPQIEKIEVYRGPRRMNLLIERAQDLLADSYRQRKDWRTQLPVDTEE